MKTLVWDAGGAGLGLEVRCRAPEVKGKTMHGGGIRAEVRAEAAADRAYRAASRVHALLRLRRPPVEPLLVARRLGVMVSETSRLSCGVQAATLRGRPGPGCLKVIFLAQGLDEPQRRFWCGHELGHILLEDEPSEGETERACSRFASRLLLPPGWLGAARARTSNLHVLAALFGVPPLAVALALKEAGLPPAKSTPPPRLPRPGALGRMLPWARTPAFAERRSG